MTDPSYYNSPQNAIPGPLSGQYYRFTPTYIRGRNPTNLDTKPKENQGFYPIGSIWVNSSSPPEIFILASITSLNGAPSANWVLVANSTIVGPLLTISDNAGTVISPSDDTANPPGNIKLVAGPGITIVGTASTTNPIITISNSGSNQSLVGDDSVAVGPDGLGNINTVGATVANSTSSKAVFTTGNAGTFTETINVQVGAAIAATDITKVGLVALSNAQFAVDANGFVTLAGGTTAPVLGLTPDASTGPGTSPVIPDGSGDIVLKGGATFATGTQANPIRTNSIAANTVDLQIQLAGSNAAVSTANNFGVAQFDSNAFTVASGYVSLNNGGTTGAVTTLTGNSGAARPPTAGNINVVGTGSITVAGAASTLTAQLTGLTNHALQVGAGTATLTQLATGSVGQVLQSGGAGGDPTWSTPTYPSTNGAVGTILRSDGTNNVYTTATYPATTTINQLLYSSAANTVSGVTAANSAVLVSSSTGVPTWTSSLTNGQVVIGSTGATPVAATITGANGITITTGAGTLQVSNTNGSPVTSVTLDAATTPITPSSGAITLTGGQVATGTTNNVIRTRGNTANSCTIEVQRSTVSASANSNVNGVCHFDSSKFGVDSNGFVTFTGSLSAMTWSDQGGNFNAAVSNGYFCSSTLTATLPATPGIGNEIDFVVTGTGIVTITANTGQKIKINTFLSSTAGTIQSNTEGSSLVLVYRASDAIWYATDALGTWTVH